VTRTAQSITGDEGRIRCPHHQNLTESGVEQIHEGVVPRVANATSIEDGILAAKNATLTARKDQDEIDREVRAGGLVGIIRMTTDTDHVAEMKNTKTVVRSADVCRVLHLRHIS
jgi:hypothetical protein